MASFDDTWHIVMPSGGGIHTINFCPYLSAAQPAAQQQTPIPMRRRRSWPARCASRRENIPFLDVEASALAAFEASTHVTLKALDAVAG
jgi:hypothetical protein